MVNATIGHKTLTVREGLQYRAGVCGCNTPWACLLDMSNIWKTRYTQNVVESSVRSAYCLSKILQKKSAKNSHPNACRQQQRDMNHDMTKPTKWMCAQQRLRSAWASAQSDQCLRCPHEETLGTELLTERTAKTDQTGRMPRLSESSLSAQPLCCFFSWCGSYY